MQVVRQVGTQAGVKGMEIEAPNLDDDLKNIDDTLVNAHALLIRHVSVNITPTDYAKIVDTLDELVKIIITCVNIRDKNAKVLLVNCLDSLQQAKTSSERHQTLHQVANLVNCVMKSALSDTAEDIKGCVRADGNKTRRKMDSGSREVRENDKLSREDRALLDEVNKRLRKQKNNEDAAKEQGKAFCDKKSVRNFCKNVFEEAVAKGKPITFKNFDRLRTRYYNDAPRFGYFLEGKH